MALMAELIFSLLAAIVLAGWLLLAGHGWLLALAAYSFGGSLTLLLLASVRALRSRH